MHNRFTRSLRASRAIFPTFSSSETPRSTQVSPSVLSLQNLRSSKANACLEKALSTAHVTIRSSRLLNVLESDPTAKALRARLQTALKTNNLAEANTIAAETSSLVRDVSAGLAEKHAEERRLYERRRKGLTNVTWRSNPIARLVALARGDWRGVNDVSRKDQRRFISACAWGIALVGLVIALAFLIVEFLQSQWNPARREKFIDAAKLKLPVLTFCSAVPDLPAFGTYPNEQYYGIPLFRVTKFLHLQTGEKLIWPKTHDPKQGIVSSVHLGMHGICDEDTGFMSLPLIASAIEVGNVRKCLSCFQIGATRSLWLSAKNFTKHPQGAIQVEFSIAREIAFCLVPSNARSTYLSQNLMKSLKSHSTDLLNLGILSLNGTKDIQFALDNAYDGLRRLKKLSEYQSALASFLCNVYFGSGYFYPKEPLSDIRYTFHLASLNWQPSGRGPYHNVSVPNTIDGVRSLSQKGVRDQLASFDARRELNNLTYSASLVRNLLVFAKEGSHEKEVHYSDRVGILSELKRTTFLFTESFNEQNEEYRAVRSAGSQFLDMGTPKFYLFNAAIDFLHFRSQKISRQPTTSVTEFVTDVFEYAGLFTGVCAYSLLVGPARLYLKRSNARSTAEELEGAEELEENEPDEEQQRVEDVEEPRLE